MLENMAEKENHGSSVPELNSVGATGIKIQDIYQQIITKAYNEDKDMVQMNPTPSELPKEDDNVEKGPALLVDNLTQALKSHPAYKQNMKIRHYKLNIPPDADKEKFVKVVSDTLVKTAPQQIKLGAGRKGLLYTLPNTAVKQFQMKSEIPNADKKRKRTHSPHKPNKKRTSVRQSMGIRTPVPVQLFSKDLPVPPVMNFPATIKDEHTEPTEHMEFSWYDEVMNEMIPIKTEADATHLPTFCTSGHEDPKLEMKTSVVLENLNLKEEDGPWRVPDMISSIEFPPEFSLTADKPFVEMDYAYDPCVDSNRDVSVYGTINMPYLNWSTNIDELPVYDWEDGKKREGNRTETYSRNIMKKKKNHVESSGGTTTVIKLEVEKREECQPPVQVSSRLIEDENSGEEELDVENHTDASHSAPYTGHNISCVEVKQEPL